MAAIRVEIPDENDLYRVYLWLMHHRGQTVDAGDGRMVRLGVPVSGARATIVAAVVEGSVGGVLRALATSDASRPVRLVFDIRSTRGVDPDGARKIGASVLTSIAAQISRDELFASVA